MFARDDSGQLRVVRESTDGEMNYLIAGMLNQPGAAFWFWLDELDGGVTLVEYENTGWRAEETAEKILADVAHNNYQKVRIFAISVGDQVARYLEAKVGDNADVLLEIVAINPCSAAELLKLPVAVAAYTLTPLTRFGCYLLGWASLSPTKFLPASGGDYSLTLLTDQGQQIIDQHVPNVTIHTVAVLVSEEDEFLDSEAICQYFPNAQIIFLPNTKHSDTFANAEVYREALLEVLQNSSF